MSATLLELVRVVAAPIASVVVVTLIHSQSGDEEEISWEVNLTLGQVCFGLGYNVGLGELFVGVDELFKLASFRAGLVGLLARCQQRCWVYL